MSIVFSNAVASVYGLKHINAHHKDEISQKACSGKNASNKDAKCPYQKPPKGRQSQRLAAPNSSQHRAR